MKWTRRWTGWFRSSLRLMCSHTGALMPSFLILFVGTLIALRDTMALREAIYSFRIAQRA
jgi:hypothetical protein